MVICLVFICFLVPNTILDILLSGPPLGQAQQLQPSPMVQHTMMNQQVNFQQQQVYQQSLQNIQQQQQQQHQQQQVWLLIIHQRVFSIFTTKRDRFYKQINILFLACSSSFGPANSAWGQIQGVYHVLPFPSATAGKPGWEYCYFWTPAFTLHARCTSGSGKISNFLRWEEFNFALFLFSKLQYHIQHLEQSGALLINPLPSPMLSRLLRKLCPSKIKFLKKIESSRESSPKSLRTLVSSTKMFFSI